MFKSYDMECPKCGERMEELLEYDQVAGEATEELLCPVCGTVMVPTPFNKTATGNVHSSAGRWNDHNMVG